MIYLAGITQNFHAFGNVAQEQGRLVLTGSVLADFSDFHHLSQLVQVASNQIQKGQLVEVLGSLITHFDHLMVT